MMGVDRRKGVDLINCCSLRLQSSSSHCINTDIPPSNCGGSGRSDREVQEPGGLIGYLERHGAVYFYIYYYRQITSLRTTIWN